MGLALFCTAATDQEAYRFVAQLRIVGVAAADITMLSPEVRPHGGLVHARRSKAPEGSVLGAVTGGLAGGILAGLVATGTVAVPLSAIVTSAGPVLAALAGAAVGGAAGGVAGAIAGARLPEYELRPRRNGRGRSILISVHVTDRALGVRARTSLRAAGAEDVAFVREARHRVRAAM